MWKFEPRVEKGERVSGGDIVGVVQETAKVEHRIMVPAGIEGIVEEVRSGEFRVDEHVVTLDNGKTIHLMQEWSVREPRTHNGKHKLGKPFLTGQRVFDTLFPLAEGGVAIVPGGFGTGKTVVQHTMARYARSDIIVYVGCGERGNEMAEVLQEFPKLTDPESGLPLSFRTVLIVNTSNMPVAAREASIYTGITIAEYYRDMGYTVSLMADSTSRWAEAMREISSRLEELPGEEGFPPYLSTRLGSFYERAGRVEVTGRPEREGSITVISAVSPPGGIFQSLSRRPLSELQVSYGPSTGTSPTAVTSPLLAGAEATVSIWMALVTGCRRMFHRSGCRCGSGLWLFSRRRGRLRISRGSSAWSPFRIETEYSLRWVK